VVVQHCRTGVDFLRTSTGKALDHNGDWLAKFDANAGFALFCFARGNRV
jgi:hypothetical protein